MGANNTCKLWISVQKHRADKTDPTSKSFALSPPFSSLFTKMLQYLWSLIMGQAQNTQDPQRPLKITPLQQRYPHIHLPKKYGPSNQHMHAIDLKKQGVDEFNPELYPNIRLKHVWAKILAIGEPRAFSKYDYITAYRDNPWKHSKTSRNGERHSRK